MPGLQSGLIAARLSIAWVHALAGAVWVGACTCFLIASAALSPQSAEWREFARRLAPPLNRLNLAAAGLLAVTGLASLLGVGIPWGWRFSPTFLTILGTKVALFVAMTAGLVAAVKAESKLGGQDNGGDGDSSRAIGRLVKLHGATAGLGGLALALGLWLTGS